MPVPTEPVEALFERLLQAGPGRGELLIRNDRRFQRPELIHLLVDEVETIVVDDPRSGKRLAQMALMASEELDATEYGRSLVTRCRVLALAQLGNSHRLIGDTDEADRVLGEAQSACTRRGADERAVVATMLTSLRREQCRLAEAEAAAIEAIQIYERLADEVGLARALCKLGGLRLESAAPPEEAETPLREALVILDEEEDPWGAICIRENLSLCHLYSGRVKAARRLLDVSAALGDFRRSNPAFRLWLEGLLAATQGEFESASSILRSASDHLRCERGIWDQLRVLIGLDLAALYARHRSYAELRAFSRELSPLMFSPGLHSEAVHGLALLLRTINFEACGAELIEALSVHIRRSRFEPGLRFLA